MTVQSVTATISQGTGMIWLLPQTYSSVQLSSTLSSHWTEGRAVYRGCGASPPRVLGLWRAHQEPPLVFTDSCSRWFASMREAIASQPPRLLTIILIGLQVWRASIIFPSSLWPHSVWHMTSRLKASLGYAKYTCLMNNVSCHLAALYCYASLVLIFNFLPIWVSSIPN